MKTVWLAIRFGDGDGSTLFGAFSTSTQGIEVLTKELKEVLSAKDSSQLHVEQRSNGVFSATVRNVELGQVFEMQVDTAHRVDL